MGARQKTVGKDFSVLKVRERIDVVALQINQMPFNGQKERAFQPRDGTIVHKIWIAGKLTMRQQRAWSSFTKDVDRARGNSGSQTSSYGEFTDKSDEGFKVPKAFTNMHYDRVMWIVNRHLSNFERLLLRDLIQDELRSNSGLSVKIIGCMRSGYKNDATAQAAGTAHVQTLLDRLADYYQY